MKLLAFFLSFSALATTEVTLWHSMGGDRGEQLRTLVSRFNQSQKGFKVVPIYKGNYSESLNTSIAAYRGKRQPHIVQVYEAGTVTMMNSGAIYPVEKLFREQNIDVNFNDFLDPVISFYRDSKKGVLSMPFNSSTPIFFYNKDLLKKAGIKKAPTTWEEVHQQSQKLVKSGSTCGTTISWQSWILLENFSSIHDIALASKGNGFDGLSTELKFNNPLVLENIKILQKGIQDKSFSYEGRRSEPSRTAFLAGRCGFYMDSSSQLSTVQKLAKFGWGAAMLPHKKAVRPRNSIIGGASLWVFNGHQKKEYQGVGKFLQFLANNENQAWWHKTTGYLPITKTAYQMLKKQGYYKKVPAQEVAITQLLRSKTGVNTRGVRLGAFPQVRDVINTELEKIWAGQVTPEKGLKTAVNLGNRILKKYARTVRR